MRTPPARFTIEQQRIWILVMDYISDPNERFWEKCVNELLEKPKDLVQQVLIDILTDYGTRYDFKDAFHPPFSYWFDGGVQTVINLAEYEPSRHLVIPCLPALISILPLPLDPIYCDPSAITDTLELCGGIAAYPQAIPGIISVLRRHSHIEIYREEMTAHLRKFSVADLAPYQIAVQEFLDP